MPPLFTSNVALGPPLRLSRWRRVALGSWGRPGDPSVYGVLEIDARPALAYLERLRAGAPGTRITLTHVVGRALAEVFRRHPDLNCVLRLGRLYPRRGIDLFFQATVDAAGAELSGLMIRDADRKPVAAIAREMEAEVRRLREHLDPGFAGFKRMARAIPGLLLRPLLRLSEILLYDLNVWTPWIGVPRDPFGSAMITNVGSLGLDFAFAALVPVSRVPIVLSLGAVREGALARDGRVEAAPLLRLCVTVDHRLIDGAHGARMSRELSQILAEPARHLGDA